MQDDDSSFWTYSIIALPKTKHYLVTAQSYLRPSQTEREFIVNLGKRKHVLLLAPRMDGAFRKWVFMAKMSNTKVPRYLGGMYFVCRFFFFWFINIVLV